MQAGRLLFTEQCRSEGKRLILLCKLHDDRQIAEFSSLLSCQPLVAAAMTDQHVRDPAYFEELARVARLKAAEADGPDLALRLKEAAVRHERLARKLRLENELE